MTYALTAETTRVANGKTLAATDETLVSRMARGDQNALRLLFQRHHTRILRFILRFVKDSEAAQEVANDTFLIAWRQAATFEGRSLVATWLLGIARFRALGATKLKRPAFECLDEQYEATLADPSDGVEVRMQRDETDAQLKTCLASLPPEQRVLIEMHYFRDMSLKDAAAITGLPLNTVKTRMFLARKKLVKMLAADDDDAISSEQITAAVASRSRYAGSAGALKPA